MPYVAITFNPTEVGWGSQSFVRIESCQDDIFHQLRTRELPVTENRGTSYPKIGSLRAPVLKVLDTLELLGYKVVTTNTIRQNTCLCILRCEV